MRDIAAEAYYILGAYENWKGDDFQATEHLKQAEALGGSAIIRGMTQYKLGRISESEQLYEVAAHYYENAIPYMETAGLPLYAASAYRELARTKTPSGSRTPSNSRTPSGSPCLGGGKDREYFFERALDWAHQTGDTLLYLDILYAEKTLLGADQNEVIAISKYLCDTAGIVRYAYDLVKYNLKKEDYATAAHYLDVLATDTNALTWSKEKYTFLKSQLLHQEKQDKEAYEELLSLYNKQSGEIEETGKSRTFAIAQRYDNEAERAKNLQLELEKQRLYMSLAAMIIAVLVVTILLIIYLSRRHARALVEKAEQEQHIESLKNELALRRDSLKKILQERIYLTKNLQESIVRHSEEGEIPEWAKTFVEVNIFTNEEQWGDFRKKFNEAYGNLLSSLKEEHPQLTTSDMQVIALTLIGLDISDICLLLNLTKRTIWSRRQRIKEHVGLGNDESLEDWLSKFGTGFA